MLDPNGIVTEQFVKEFENFDGSPQEFIEFISTISKNAKHCFVIENAVSEIFETDVKKVKFITGGYSSYERIAGMIKNSYFGYRFWESTHRGGMFVYEIPMKKWDEKMKKIGLDIRKL